MIDAREIRLKKWGIPKVAKETAGALAIGYFDIIEAKDVNKIDEQEKEKHPLIVAYKNSYRTECKTGDKMHEEYWENEHSSIQAIKAFTNVAESEEKEKEGEGFLKETIEEFWNCQSAMCYLSMLHVDLEVDISKVLQKIRELFKGNQYIYYLTFDYSGIILLAKGMDIQSYVNQIFKLNYENQNYVRDSFSAFAISKFTIQDIYRQMQFAADREIKCEQDLDTSIYSIVVNISIGDYEQYIKFRDELNLFEEQHSEVGSHKFMQLGRHDISIVNDNGNLLWLLCVQNLLKKYSEKSEESFWAYESFVKVKIKEDINMRSDRESIKETADADSLMGDDEKKDPWIKAEAVLKALEKRFIELAKKQDKRPYIVPVEEVSVSLLAILKNRFAEDFLICVYESFVEFLNYLCDKLENNLDQKNREKELNNVDNCYCNYFACLNSLINSAMHTERQFIQTTAFNAIFYDIPPKLMAFYVSMIYNTKIAMQTADDFQYTFIVTPSFSDTICVEVISYEEKTPQNRLLKVSINESSLYNPKRVISVMTHEVAHYVGGTIRERAERKKRIIDTLVFKILNIIFEKKYTVNNAFYKMKENIVASLSYYNEFIYEKLNYRTEIQYLYRSILEYFCSSRIVKEEMKKYIRNQIEAWIVKGDTEKFLENAISSERIRSLSEIQKKYLIETLYSEVRERLLNVCKRELNHSREKEQEKLSAMSEYMSMLISLYYESYADLQMILLLKLSYQDYLYEFVEALGEDNVNVSNNDEACARIAVISKLMMDVGLWNGFTEKEADPLNINIKHLDSKIKTIQKKMNSFIGDFSLIMQIRALIQESELWEIDTDYISDRQKNSPTEDIYECVNLYFYLGKCMKRSIEYYSGEKKEIIKELRESKKIIEEFEDIHVVYEGICRVLTTYRKNIQKDKTEPFNGGSICTE